MISQIGGLNEYVKLYMKLVTSRRYYVLNGRTIHLLKKGCVDMSATTSEDIEHNGIEGEPGFSDAELSRNTNKETQVEISIIEKPYKSRWIILSIS